MSQILRLVQAELVSRMRDKSFWLEALLLPIIVTAIMGLALGRVGHGKAPTVYVAIVASSRDLVAAQVLEAAYTAAGSLNVKFYGTADEARADLKARKLDSIVLVSDADPFADTKTPFKVAVESGKTTQFQATMVAQITEAALRTMMAEGAARKSVAELLVAQQMDPSPAWVSPTPTPVSAKLEQVSLNQFDALGAQFAGLAVFFSLLSAFRLMVNIFGDHRRGLNLRLAGLPAHPAYVAAGYIGTVALVASIQTVTVLAVGALAFSVKWGALAALVLATLLASVASATVALVLAVLPVSTSARGLIGTLFVLGGSVLGGSLVPLDGASPTLQFFAKATLHYWVTGLFTGLSRGLTVAEVSQLFVGVAAYGSVALALATLFLSRRRPGRA